MSVKDMIKKSVLESGVFDQYNISSILVALVAALALGILIFLVYRRFYTGVIYSRTFAVTLVGMTVLTCMVTLAISTNVVISLGMVGALSIVRFRSAIKEPMDIAFLFWSISVGIVLGAGLIPLAILGAVFIGIVMVLFANKKTTDNPYILVVNCKNDISENSVLNILSKNVNKYCVKSKTISPSNGIEMTIEVKLKNITTSFVNEVSKIEGVSNAVLVSYNGDYMA